MPGTRRALSPTADAARARTAAATRELLRTQLSAAVDALRSEDHVRAWLRACATLPRYSPAIVLLIVSQALRHGLEPDVVASFSGWHRLGCRVRAGEHGLMIRRPVHAPRKDHAQDEPNLTEQAIPPGDRRVVNFRPDYVFCRSQVEPAPGKQPAPLELPDPPVPGATFAGELARLERSLRTDVWTITREHLPPGVGGTCNLELRAIRIGDDLEPNAQLRILIHEAAHAEGVTGRTHDAHAPNAWSSRPRSSPAPESAST